MPHRLTTPPEGPIRLLSFDGGGIRGLLSLEIALELETQLRRETGNPGLVLADHFHYIAGTSTGAIIAACLSWGMTVGEVIAMYEEKAAIMFSKAAVWRRLNEKFDALGLRETFQAIFAEDGQPATMGSEKLRTLLLVVTRNASSGSPWPLTNNPLAKYNVPSMPGSNLNFPIWQVLRASTAAPTYFPPEVIEITDESTGKVSRCAFEDGGITPYNNPAFLLYLKATLPEYHLCWPDGAERMSLVSIGTGIVPAGRKKLEFNIMADSKTVPMSLHNGIAQHQDLMCRLAGECRFGAPLDGEVGDLIHGPKPGARFLYARYNLTFAAKEIQEARRLSKQGFTLDNVDLMQYLRELGRGYASANVRLAHVTG